jgi:glucans biosynthesis protein
LAARLAGGDGGAAGRGAPCRASAPPRAPRALALALLAALLQAPPAARAFDLDDVAKKAEAQARQAFRDPAGEVPVWLREVSYDQWRDIRFRPDLALWRDL